jgi:L-fucose isomerase
MTNVPDEQIYRPHVWGLFGQEDLIGSDYRACKNFGPIYG